MIALGAELDRMRDTMTAPDHVLLTRRRLLEYFEDAFAPRDRWQVGMELEKMALSAEIFIYVPFHRQRQR